MSTVFEFGALIHNPLLLHQWMVEQHLLPEHMDCPECGATMKPGIGTTTLCCSKRSLHANNKAVKVSWLKGTFFEGSLDKKTFLNIIHCFSLRLNYDLGMVERESWELRLEIGTNNKRNRATLIPLIKRYVAPGTLIITDCWAAYSSFDQEGYSHETVNHSQHFVDRKSGAHTQQIESLWRALLIN